MKKLHKEALDIEEYILPPIDVNTRNLCNHINRYSTAMIDLNININDSILDASCGTGYGTYFISDKVKCVTGIDINNKFLAIARKNFSKSNIEFIHYNDLGSKIFDKIVCIETIEHMGEEYQEIFIDKLLNHLKENGDMYITTPLGNDKQSDYNLYHLNELSLNTHHGMFKKKFRTITFEIYLYKNSYDKEEECVNVILEGYKR